MENSKESFRVAEELAISRATVKDFGFRSKHSNLILKSALIHDVVNRWELPTACISDSVGEKCVNYVAEGVPRSAIF